MTWNIQEDIIYSKIIQILKNIININQSYSTNYKFKYFMKLNFSNIGFLLKSEFKRRKIILKYNNKCRNINYYIKNKYNGLKKFLINFYFKTELFHHPHKLTYLL